MVSTLSLVAASLLLGQTTDVPSGPAPAAKVYVYSNGVLVPYNGPAGSVVTQQPAESHHPILSKIQGWFGKRSTPSSTIPMETAPPPTIVNSPVPNKAITTPTPSMPTIAPTSVPTGDYPRKMPTSLQNPAPGSEVRATPNADTVSTVSSAALNVLPVPTKSPILPANANRIGRDEKFEWVTGQLEMEKGQYVLYYATPETVDTYHGRIMVNPQRVDLHAFHSGDLVSMRGQLLSGHGTPVYQLTSADLVEKAKR